MARLKSNWMFVLLFITFIVVTNPLPLLNVPPTATEVVIPDLPKEIEVRNGSYGLNNEENATQPVLGFKESAADENIINQSLIDFNDGNLDTRFVRPGLTVTRYTVQITRDGNNFNGRAVIDVEVDQATRNVPLRFHCEGLNIQTVQVGLLSGANMQNNPHNVAGIVLEIPPAVESSQYRVIITYIGQIRNDGRGLFISEYDDDLNFMAMNLHPINARRVFPCIDEPITSMVSFSFVDMDFPNMVSNAGLEENSEDQFKAVEGPVHTFGMVAHDFQNINLPTPNTLLYVRPDTQQQDRLASTVINFMFTNLQEWTQKPYNTMLLNQDGQMHIFALPDTNRDWYALSMVCIWEPYILSDVTHSMAQSKLVMTTIAEAMARQWYGNIVFPENWRHQWIITGLYKYAAYDLLTTFQTNPTENEVTTNLDMNSIFVTDIIQESLLQDSYRTAQAMELADNIFNDNLIRDHINGILNYKAPAILRMLGLLLGDDEDYIKLGARALLLSRNLQPVNTLNLLDALNSEWLNAGSNLINNIGQFLQPYITNTGYPVINVTMINNNNNINVIQERFSFGNTPDLNYNIPISFTTSANPNFDNVHPTRIITNRVEILDIAIGPDDWILFNLQGQGYYRVNYGDMWLRIIDALADPETREVIHVLNRATLVDDSLNLARGRKLSYDTALSLALTMEHETEYAVWKAFIRNMKFLKKFLIAKITEDPGLDQDIYMRMIRRTIVAFEETVGFSPSPNENEPAMVSLTRGLVMDHACRSNYDPCIAAAVDWFFGPNNEVVNPNIPRDLRPAVYCTMVREGDEDIIEMLEARLEEETSHYERLVILEAMACSQDSDFIEEYLLSTIAPNSPYGMEERLIIFKAVAESSYENLNAAMTFLRRNTGEVRNFYGGPDRLESAIWIIAENMASPAQAQQLEDWINNMNHGLGDSLPIAQRARVHIAEQMEWSRDYLEEVYEWIDENDAPSLIVSSLLIFMSLCLAIFNR